MFDQVLNTLLVFTLKKIIQETNSTKQSNLFHKLH